MLQFVTTAHVWCLKAHKLLAVVDRQKLIFQNCYDQRIENRESHMHTVLQICQNSCKDDHPFLPSFLLSSSLAFHSIRKGDIKNSLEHQVYVCTSKPTNWNSTRESHHHSEKTLLLTLNSQPLELDTPKKSTTLQHTIMTLHLILLGFNIRINTRKLVFITRISFHFNVVQQDTSLGFYHQV
jgi:hypothetical protein